MKKFTKILFFLTIFGTASSISQNIKGARYSVTPDGYLQLIEDYPAKKEKIAKSIESDLMKYVDLINLEDKVIQIYWSYQDTLKGIVIYTKQKIYYLSSENILTEENIDFSIDTTHYKRIIRDSLYSYNLTEKDATPVQLKVKDSLESRSFQRKSIINNYPEISFILDYNVFPQQISFGKPKPFMTYDFLSNSESKVLISKEEFEELTKNLNSKTIRHEILTKILKRNTDLIKSGQY